MQRGPFTVLVTSWIAVTMAGCVTAGRGIDGDVPSKLAPSITSKSDVKALFGNPDTASLEAFEVTGCVEQWSYIGKGPTIRLTVSFNANGRVCSWSTVSHDSVAAAANDGDRGN